MTICYVGTYNPKYPRNKVLIEGLRKNGVTIIECNSRRPWIFKYISLAFQLLLKARRVDAFVVGFPMGNGVVALLSLFRYFISPLIRGINSPQRIYGGVMNLNAHNPLSPPYLKGETLIPTIIDGFVSQYDAEVFDRKHIAEGSKEANKLFRWEQEAFRFASKVLVDTQANAEYYSKLFSIPLEHFVVVPVGTDEGLFKPACHPEPARLAEAQTKRVEGPHSENFKVMVRPASTRGEQAHHDSKNFLVHFSGTYNALQGIDVIVRAIHLLEMKHKMSLREVGATKQSSDFDIRVQFVGRGEEYEQIIQLAKELGAYNRIEFIDRVPYDEYARLMMSADICLGIFSDSQKAKRVIPNKVVEAMACGKAIITSDTAAIRELLIDGENVRLCKPSDPEDLANKVFELYRDDGLRMRLGERARKMFLEHLTTEKIGKELLEIFTLDSHSN